MQSGFSSQMILDAGDGSKKWKIQSTNVVDTPYSQESNTGVKK